MLWRLPGPVLGFGDPCGGNVLVLFCPPHLAGKLVDGADRGIYDYGRMRAWVV